MKPFTIPPHAIKGRGTATRIAHRFEREGRDAFDDGWGPQEEDMIEAGLPRTEVRFEDVKSALSHNDSPDIPFEASLNPYRGCEHGCIYTPGCISNLFDTLHGSQLGLIGLIFWGSLRFSFNAFCPPQAGPPRASGVCNWVSTVGRLVTKAPASCACQAPKYRCDCSLQNFQDL